MRATSKEYKKEMQFPWRNQWLFRLYIGAIDNIFQNNAVTETITPVSFLGKNFEKNLFRNTDSSPLKNIATFERKTFKADGSGIFIDRNYESDDTFTLDTGYVSNGLSSVNGDINCEIAFKCNKRNTRLKGLTFDFGTNYPVSFDIECRDRNNLVVFNKNYTNEKSLFTVVEDFGESVSKVTLTVNKMNQEGVRFRLQQVLFGIGIMFDNEDIILSENSLRTSFNNQSLELPNVDLTVSLQNYDELYDFENPNSFINLYDKNQDARFEILYTLENGDTESACVYDLKLNDYSIRDNVLVVNVTDFLRDENNEIEFTNPEEFPTNLYDVLMKVWDKRKHRDFNLIADRSLREIPMRFHHFKTSVKQAVFNIASVGGCRMILSGKNLLIYKKKQVDTDFTATSDNKTVYSDMKLLSDLPVTDMATLEFDRVKANGKTSFPDNKINPLYRTGFISESISNEKGKFLNPVTFDITMKQSTVGDYLYVLFDNYVYDMQITTYLNGIEVESYTQVVNGNTAEIYRYFEPFDKMTVSVSSIDKPFNRLYVREVSFAQPVYHIKEDLCLGRKPKIEKKEKIKSINIPYITSTKSPNGDYADTVNQIEVICNDMGSDLRYDNPFVTTPEVAAMVGESLKQYCNQNIVYDIDFVGDPSLETTDIIKLENKYNNDLLCIVESNDIMFTNGGVSGKIRARRL